MRLSRPLTVVLAAGATLLAMPATVRAQATTVTCGQEIVRDTTLANDLTNCPGDGLLIGADGITLDLNGHTIDGDGVPSGDPDVGIVNGVATADHFGREAYDRVTIRNGVIRDFETGVVFTLGNTQNAPTDSLITELSLDGGDIRFLDADDNRIEGNVLIGAGIELVHIDRNRVTGNRITGGRISLEQFGPPSGPPRVTDNLIAANTVVDAPADGIIFEELSCDSCPTGNRFVNNTVRRSAGDGIKVHDGASVLVRGNTVSGNGSDGIDIGTAGSFDFGDPGTVTDNVANSNAVLGINADDDVIDGGGNQATGNGDARQCVNVVCRPHGFLFGAGNPATSFSSMTANAKRASRFFLFFPATVSALRAYLDGGGAASGSQVLRAVIYTDAGGQPGQPLLRSFQGGVEAGFGPAWVTLHLPFRLELSPGHYWLGLHSGADSNVARFGWSSSPGARRFNIDSYLDGPSSPFGAAPSDEKRIAIHTIGYARPSE